MPDHWPLFKLRMTTPRLELRLPTLEDLDQLGDRAAEGIHDPEVMPFVPPWTDVPSEDLPRNVVLFNLGEIARWRPERWCCNFAVIHDGRAIGIQDLSAADFAVTREVHTGSWLGRSYQGRGLGTEMRAAVLHLAFTGLGALSAVSSAFEHNTSSLAVSRKLGYEPDGLSTHNVRGQRAVARRLRLRRDAFAGPVPVEIHGLEPCLSHFGLT
ncbi:GNAT family protein [Microbispora corallina]|uniref:Succinyl-CoA transferase Rv0802c n=1 Tax=Microbispora corallina TaxID=83302 RepID=A0ABQ4FX75_9ACTN|nr:GNAT family N-acetyltransferase [Microbispora corallina]GIH39413.1 succinyl-CoA transferase Rv0802c [Microbispora corallina]